MINFRETLLTYRNIYTRGRLPYHNCSNENEKRKRLVWSKFLLSIWYHSYFVSPKWKIGLFWQQSAIGKQASCFPLEKSMKAVGTRFLLHSLLIYGCTCGTITFPMFRISSSDTLFLDTTRIHQTLNLSNLGLQIESGCQSHNLIL